MEIREAEWKFGIGQYLWAVGAMLRFWNKRFRPPYRGMKPWQAVILMKFRGQRPATVEDVLSGNYR